MPRNVCSHPYAPGLGVASTTALLSAAKTLTATQIDKQPTVTAEPKVLSDFRR